MQKQRIISFLFYTPLLLQLRVTVATLFVTGEIKVTHNRNYVCLNVQLSTPLLRIALHYFFRRLKVKWLAMFLSNLLPLSTSSNKKKL
jgi:hypothetical protein